MSQIFLGFTIFIAMLNVATPTRAEDHPTYGAELEGFDYPHDVYRYKFRSQGSDVSMAYMDVKPEAANGRTVVLLHGRNFCAATWEKTITILSKAGFRVIAPDQIGFCKSTKPLGYQFSIQQLATNSNALLTSLGISRPTIIGHSFGGMMAIRYALMYPDAVEQIVLVNPIGLEDWQAKGVPFIELDKGLEIEKATTFDSIKQYEQRFYYAGQWKPEYDRWVEMSAGMYRGPGAERIAQTQARIAEMAFIQPVVHEFRAHSRADDSDDRAIGPHCAGRQSRTCGSCEAAWKLSRVGPRGGKAHPERQAYRVPGTGARPADPGTGSIP
jgi:pimeloyl-ACP methyl ester carboxylesterase